MPPVPFPLLAQRMREKWRQGVFAAMSNFDLVLHKSMCNNLHMATNLAIDDKLIEEARRLGEHKTKKQAVTTALQQYIERHKQLQILEDFGTVDFDPEYDYKAWRRGKRE